MARSLLSTSTRLTTRLCLPRAPLGRLIWGQRIRRKPTRRHHGDWQRNSVSRRRRCGLMRLRARPRALQPPLTCASRLTRARSLPAACSALCVCELTHKYPCSGCHLLLAQVDTEAAPWRNSSHTMFEVRKSSPWNLRANPQYPFRCSAIPDR